MLKLLILKNFSTNDIMKFEKKFNAKPEMI